MPNRGPPSRYGWYRRNEILRADKKLARRRYPDKQTNHKSVYAKQYTRSRNEKVSTRRRGEADAESKKILDDLSCAINEIFEAGKSRKKRDKFVRTGLENYL